MRISDLGLENILFLLKESYSLLRTVDALTLW